MKTTATFEHGRKQWCVQVVELGPSPILFYCRSEARARQLSDAINKGKKIRLGTSFLAGDEKVYQNGE
jgi:hypothetical protein